MSCGHSLCTPCLGGAVPSRCPLCQEKLKLLGVGGPRRNVVLCNLLEKCEDRGRRLAGLVARVRHHLTRGEAKEALGVAQKGVELGKHPLGPEGLGGWIGAGGPRRVRVCCPAGVRMRGWCWWGRWVPVWVTLSPCHCATRASMSWETWGAHLECWKC